MQQPSPPPLARAEGRPSRTRVAIAGGGRIGTAIAALLGPTGDYDLTIVDRIAPQTTARTTVADVTDPGALARAVAGSDIVVNALPFHLTTTCLDAALTV